jgi:diguanylate cyclase (GGDEF)-like protein
MSSTYFRYLLVLLLVASPAHAGPPTIELSAATATADAWPALTVLADAHLDLSPEQALARLPEFAPPETPHANMGVRRDAVWLRVPVRVVPGAPKRWILSVDYASIDHIDMYLVDAGQPARHVVLGRAVPFSKRAWPSSRHAAMVELEPERPYEFLLRVATTSTMIVPLTLSTPEAFHAQEARTQALQGLMAGAALCLLIYSLTQWVGLRDPMFLHYALTLAGTTLFFVTYFGLGPQHLWGDNGWLSEHTAPLSVLLGGLVGGFLFVDRALCGHDTRSLISRGLRAGAATAGFIGGLFAAYLIDYRLAQLSATLLGPMPMLLAVPAAWARARTGERVGLYMLIGWSVYALGALTMVGLLRGYVASNFWTQHAFQFASFFEMLMWMRILGIRIEDMRASAQRAHLERDALRSLAHTDALTGLPNRRGLNEALSRVLPSCAPEQVVAVFLLDLDGFKPINDRLGHDAGDELLVGVARRLQAALRTSDVVARLGGDEFVVLATGLPDNGAAQLLGQKLLDVFHEPLMAAGQLCRVGLTIGYALAPLDGRDALTLLKRADAAMYAGKQGGRHCLRRGAASQGLAAA